MDVIEIAISQLNALWRNVGRMNTLYPQCDGLLEDLQSLIRCIEKYEKIQDADNPEYLMEDESVMNVLETAGICTILNAKTKYTIVRSLILSNSEILRKQPMLDAFWEGTECVGLKTLLQNKQGKM
ncbi:Hypothetical predicted protein [Mytilus galloprovincialis]|uniref:Uncharacterized protein n=1 Tax=Mytilus galloprovincialis TaxID=29158 RepID=A0A8B6E4L8_MYTGA|nr:Hypothetical predicted protein [Mytilus galloprovincialis]